jgi:hypothetical protein
LAGFCNSAPVSGLPNWRTAKPFRAKSLVIAANIPVSASETRFDLHCTRAFRRSCSIDLEYVLDGEDPNMVAEDAGTSLGGLYLWLRTVCG